MKRLQSLCWSSHSPTYIAPDVSVSALYKRWRGWLRHYCATRLKVVDSISDYGVTGFFIVIIFQVALWSRGQIRIFPRGKDGRYVGLTTLPLSCTDFREIWEPPTSWEPHALSRPVQGLLVFTFTSTRCLSSLHILILSPQVDLKNLLSFCFI